MREHPRRSGVIENVNARTTTLAVRIWIACLASVAGYAKRVYAAPGTHQRLHTPHGPVHVWTPRDFDRATAGVVIYVHGYFTTVDRAWREHRLERQFAASGLNAVFIACEAPNGPKRDVRWTDVGELLDTVAGELGELPSGRVVVVGHSGAHRTISTWLTQDRIDTIILVDAVHDEMPQLHEWLAGDPDRRLLDTAVLTRKWADALHAKVPDTLTFERFPSSRGGKLHGARQARVVYVHSQYDHMALVTGGIALPMLLRAVQLPVVASTRRETKRRPHD